MRNRGLPFEFYQRSTKTVACELLGKKLVHQRDGHWTAGIIIETEAYLGVKDPACHTYEGRQTERVRSMYKAGGHAYVYFIYGMHFCFNVVTRTEREPEAVLVRALYPVEGIEIMRQRRQLDQRKPVAALCSGPGKLCQAMGIDRSTDGMLLVGNKSMWIEEGVPYTRLRGNIEASPRIGIAYAKEAVEWPLRFTIKNLEKIKEETQN